MIPEGGGQLVDRGGREACGPILRRERGPHVFLLRREGGLEVRLPHQVTAHLQLALFGQLAEQRIGEFRTGLPR